MRTLMFSLALLPLLVFASAAGAHEDLVPYELNGKIVTGGHDDVFASNTIERRVFGFDFGEEPSDPYFIGDPGFNNGAFAIGVFPNNGLLPASQTLRFSVLSNLQYWDGTGAVTFSPAPLGVELGLNRGAFTVYTSGTGQSGTAPTIGSTGASGRLHVHLGSLLSTTTDGTDPAAPNAPDGVYALSFKLSMPGSGVADSDSLWLVFNNGVSEEQHDSAIEFIEQTLVPEPSAWMLMATSLGALAVTGWRKRRVARGA